MKGYVCLVACCFLIVFGSAAFGQTQKKNERSAEWEYKQLTWPTDEVLNYHAKEGWEIASAAGGGSDNSFYKVILKRSKSHPLFGTRTLDLPKPEPLPQSTTCKLTLAQSPVIRGLRLGMTSDELFAVFPANEQEEFNRAQALKKAELPPNYGFATFTFILSNYPTKDRFTGINTISVGIFDRKVVSISANYWQAPQFDRPGQLIEIIRKQFGLPEYKDWPGYNEQVNNPSLVCDGFTFGLNGYSHNFSITLTDPTFQKIQDQRKQADLASQRAKFKL